MLTAAFSKTYFLHKFYQNGLRSCFIKCSELFFWEYFTKIGEDFQNNFFCIYLADIINNVSGLDAKTKSLPKICILKFVI